MFAVTLILVCTGIISSQEKRPKVAIKTFENPANYSNSTIGNGLTDILTTELQNTGKFDVLERGNVDELMKEMNFGNTEYAKGATFAQKGNLLGAQYILMGKVTNFSYAEHQAVEQKVNLFGPNRQEVVFLQQADVRVDFRLIDVSSGETVISQAGEAHKTNKSRVSEMSTWYRCTTSGSITSELSSSLVGRTTTEAIKDIVRKLNALSETVRERGAGEALSSSLDRLGGAKGQILANEGGGLWIVGGIGSGVGLQKGDRLQVTHENLVKDKAGKVVYRKQVQVGLMEVTDVSEADHAEARFLANQVDGGVASPQANDLVSVDINYARSLRGGGAGAAPGTASAGGVTAPSAPGAGSPGGDEFIKRAEGYMSDRFWSQALDQYRQAAAITPNDPRVLQGQAIAHYMMQDFIEGDESADKLIQTGSPLTVPVAHYHSMGICRGQLAIQKGKLAYTSDKSDGFEVTAGDFIGAEVRTLPHPKIAIEKAPDWPVLELRVRDEKGKEKKYEMLAYAYSRRQNPSGRSFASAFAMEDSDISDAQKLENSMLKLIQKYVR
jgi:curli biogenesis system outer membrane secretion channel CsgG